MTPLRFYDFFAGVGLVELALVPPWECVWANDNDVTKKAIYDDNFDDPRKLVCKNVEDVKADELPTPADMAWASFPCQDLSLAGWRRGINGKRSGVFWSFHEIMANLHRRGQRPPLIVIENVAGLLYGDNFSGLCEALAELDMQFGALMIDAKYFLPQSRPRVFVVAVDRTINIDAVTARWPTVGGWFPKSVWRAYDSLSDEDKALWRWWRLPCPRAAVPAIASIIEDVPTNVKWHTEHETRRLLELMSPTNLAKIEWAKRTTGRSIGFLYKRTRKDGQRAEVRFDGIAGCLRTTYGGSSRQTVVIVEQGEVRSRLLSPREAARLMGADDDFRLPDRYNDAYRAMGDGVAVPTVRWLSEHLLEPLALAHRFARQQPVEAIEFEDSLVSFYGSTSDVMHARGGRK
ncbi:MAG: DNA cytosine methyltransferase [Thermomicrobiales bacterium]